MEIRMNRIDPKEYESLIQNRLGLYVPEEKLIQAALFRAMRYSLLAGGKRIRPVLVLEFCGLCGGDQWAALPFACAVEMIHTYSLIHDDLPCMDDDDLRRGRPSNHVVFGEAQALLAGDSLLTMAFETMLSPESIQAVGAERAAEAAGVLARASGAYGMAGGQAIDLEFEGQEISFDVLRKMDECKTGELIRAACEMGCVLGGAVEAQKEAANLYAKSIGLAFQIVDDILDVTGDTATLGKPAGSDAENDKNTYVSELGIEKAKQTVEELTRTAVSALSVFEGDTEYLRSLALRLAERKS